MCIIFFSEQHGDYELVLAANRDEYLARAAAPAAFHSAFGPSSHRILSGRDLVGGGTWLGLSTPRSGDPVLLRFATLTNYTEVLPPSNRASRGELVSGFLTTEGSLAEYLARLDLTKHEYAGFNLLLGEITHAGLQLGYVTNREEQRSRILETERERARGLSNATLTTPGWTKVTDGVDRFERAVQAQGLSEEELSEKLYDVLTTANAIPITKREHLRHTILVRPICLDPSALLPAPGSDLALVASASTASPSDPPSIHPNPTSTTEFAAQASHAGPSNTAWYGTRTQTLLLVTRPSSVDGSRDVIFKERDTFEVDGAGSVRWSGQERQFRFALPGRVA